MATPVHSMDGKCHIKAEESCKTCLTNRTQPISHHITTLVVNALRGGHTDTHTYQRMNQNNFKKPGVRGLWPRAPGLKIK